MQNRAGGIFDEHEGWRALAAAETLEQVAAADLYIRHGGLFRQLGVTPEMLGGAKVPRGNPPGDSRAAVTMAEGQEKELETWASQIYDLKRETFQKIGVTEKMLVDAVKKKHQGTTMEEFMAWLEQLGLADSFRKAVTVVRPTAR